MASEDVILEMLRDPPDPNETLPMSNRSETIYGLTVPFLVLTWVFVLSRLWVRLRIIREPGWDDFFVLLSSICNTVATAFVLVSIDYGLGKHFLYLPIPTMSKYLLCFYVENALYISNTAIIKVSLLLQYLRIFKAGIMRWICLISLALISTWGLAYSVIAWFPCWPVKGYWDRTLHPICYGYGFSEPASFIKTFQSHTATNMVFDLLVFLTPMVLFTEPNLKRKNLVAMSGVFLLGAAVVFTSVWRLYSIVDNRAGTYPYIDFTWWPPISIVLSCLEIDLAIMCASVPIFWPMIESRLSQIFVTHEVRITEHRRLEENGLEYELDHARKSGSIKSGRSGSGNSEQGLTREESQAPADPFSHYKDRYVLAHVDPLANQNLPGGGISVETEIESSQKPNWRI